MIVKVTRKRYVYDPVHLFRTEPYVELFSDFKDGEQPRYTGHKRNYRKAKYSKYDFRERYERRPRCWKNQRKSKSQYKKIPHFDLTGRECNSVLVPPTMTVDEFNELVYLVNTYPALFA